jgi:ribonuclease P protein component
MLSKKNRLIREKDFNKIHKFGKFYGEVFLAIKILENNSDISRFGFLVGTKISKKAVKRNLVKRRLRESVRLKLDQIKPGYDVVFLTKPEIVEKSYDEIDKTVENVFKKSNLFL